MSLNFWLSSAEILLSVFHNISTNWSQSFILTIGWTVLNYGSHCTIGLGKLLRLLYSSTKFRWDWLACVIASIHRVVLVFTYSCFCWSSRKIFSNFSWCHNFQTGSSFFFESIYFICVGFLLFLFVNLSLYTPYNDSVPVCHLRNLLLCLQQTTNKSLD